MENEGHAMRAAFAIVISLFGACTFGPRFVVPASPPVSNTELGQDVPNDATAVQPPVIIQCADALHQGFPGGSDYKGPPVPLCPSTH
jgi:hypothetical protein